jgi:hypothetical protein
MIFDCNDRRIGRVLDVYVDVETEAPIFATAAQGFVNKSLLFVPLVSVRETTLGLRTRVTRDLVKSAPLVQIHHEELSQSDEAALYEHFGLAYSPSRWAGGRRLSLG